MHGHTLCTAGDLRVCPRRGVHSPVSVLPGRIVVRKESCEVRIAWRLACCRKTGHGIGRRGAGVMRACLGGV